MKLDCEVVEKISKAGSTYRVLRVDIGSGVMKDFFLSDSEVAIIRLCNSDN